MQSRCKGQQRMERLGNCTFLLAENVQWYIDDSEQARKPRGYYRPKLQPIDRPTDLEELGIEKKVEMLQLLQGHKRIWERISWIVDRWSMIIHTTFVDELQQIRDYRWIMDTNLTFVNKLKMSRPKVKMSQGGTAQRLEHVCLQAENNFMLINVNNE